MRQEIVFNPERDIQAVSQTGYIDIAKANATSEVTPEVSNEEEMYNGISDPRSIAGRPHDDFELMQGNKVIVSYQPESGSTSVASEVNTEDGK